jgi:hypothetical protein
MAAAQILKGTNTIDNGVGGIVDNVFVVDNSVVGIDNMAGVDKRMDEHVGGVDEKVRGVDDKVAALSFYRRIV